MPDASRDDARAGSRRTSARLRGKRVAVAVFIAFAIVFVASSAMQIIRAVFSRQATPLSSAAPGSAAVCAQGIASLLRALDRAEAAARVAPALSSALSAPESLIVFRQGLRPEWDEGGAIERACGGAPGGLESWATLLRLREALEEWIRREGTALEPLRRDVIAHLPAKLR